MKFKRLLIMSDTHCGHKVGLTPPDWQTKYLRKSIAKHNKSVALQNECWGFYTNELKKLRPIDITVMNGDAIDGRGEITGGTELLVTDRHEQCEMAKQCIMQTGARKVLLTYGSSYHTGAKEDFEDTIKTSLEGHGIETSLGSHEWININGLIFDIRHHVSTGGVPQSRSTAVKRAYLWNKIWADRQQQPDSRVFIRCLSEDTEILTNDGWKKRDTINKKHSVLTMNIKTRELEWNDINGIVDKIAEENMVHIKSKGYDVLVTGDHNMLYYPVLSKDINIKKAEELSHMHTFKVPVSGYINNSDIDMSDSLIKLLALVIAEGNMDSGNASKGYKEKNNVRIYQNVKNSKWVEDILIENKFPYTKNIRKLIGNEIKDENGKTYYSKDNGYVFYIRQPYSKKIIQYLSGEKNIPYWLMKMSNRQFELFLDVYIKGDGHLESGTSRKQGKIFTCNKDLADRIQILLVSNGYKAYVSGRKKWGKITYVIGFVKKQTIRLCAKKSFKKLDKKTTSTWCVSVKNGTIVTRRNGYVAIVGNSHAHYFDYTGNSDYLAIVTPALQAMGSKYGSRRCEGTVDFGFIHFDIYEDGSYIWQPHIAQIKSQVAKAIKL